MLLSRKLTGHCFYCALRTSPPPRAPKPSSVTRQLEVYCTHDMLHPSRVFPLEEEDSSCAATSDVYVRNMGTRTMTHSSAVGVFDERSRYHTTIFILTCIRNHSQKLFQNEFYWENYKKNVQYKVNSLTLNL